MGVCHAQVPWLLVQVSNRCTCVILSCRMLSVAQDYLNELDSPSTSIYKKSTLDRTFTVAYNNTRYHFCNSVMLLQELLQPFKV